MRIQIWQHKTSGESYAVLIEDDTVIAANGPLNYTDVEAIQAGETDIDFGGEWVELGEDIQAHEEEYRLVE